jgi:hypothetical protein
MFPEERLRQERKQIPSSFVSVKDRLFPEPLAGGDEIPRFMETVRAVEMRLWLIPMRSSPTGDSYAFME